MFLNFPFFLAPSSIVYFLRFWVSSFICDWYFSLFVYFQDARMQVRGRIRSNYALQAHRVTSTREEGFLFMKSSMCSNFSLSSRDVDLPRRDVKLTPLCHVATCIFTSRRQFAQASVTSRRHPARRDIIFTCLCYVATWDSNVAT